MICGVMCCLDIDIRATWAGPYSEMLAQLGAVSALEEVLADGKLINRPQARLERLARKVLRAGAASEDLLRDRVVEFLRSKFTHVNLYHACRIADRGTYEREGLRLSDINELDRFARAFFGQTPQLDEAIRDLRRQGYDVWNHGKIGLWFARSGAIFGGDHYLAHGSEYLGRLAGCLGPLELERLAACGRPAVIRCEMPIGELAESDIRFASILPLQEMLTSRDPDAPPIINAIQGATLHANPISPVAITIEFLDETRSA